MPLSGEYAPSTAGWARKQAETYEATGGEKAGDLQGRPVIVLTSVGARTGKLRKTALMRVEHDGADRFDATARELDGEERQVWGQRAVDGHPPDADDQRRTDRQIPVVLLEPRD